MCVCVGVFESVSICSCVYVCVLVCVLVLVYLRAFVFVFVYVCVYSIGDVGRSNQRNKSTMMVADGISFLQHDDDHDGDDDDCFSKVVRWCFILSENGFLLLCSN